MAIICRGYSFSCQAGNPLLDTGGFVATKCREQWRKIYGYGKQEGTSGYEQLDEILELRLKERMPHTALLNAAKKTANPSARKIFEELAEQEAGHKRLILKWTRKDCGAYIRHVPDLGISEYLVDLTYESR